MKTIIIGAQGMLGHALMDVFAPSHPQGWDFKELDISNKSATLKKIIEYKPELIINAAAYTNVDKAEEEKETAFQVNFQGIQNLVEASGEVGSMLVHYSTDYVFGNEQKEGYREDANPKDAINVYGQSKRAGELAVEGGIKQGLKAYLIRSSWLFGPDGKNFVQTILNLYEAKPELKIVTDQWGKPTYTPDLADATKKLIDNYYQFGIYHLVNEPATTWYEFAKTIITIKYNNHSHKSILPVSSDQFIRPAQRPHYSILLNTKGPIMRPWKEGLEEYIAKQSA